MNRCVILKMISWLMLYCVALLYWYTMLNAGSSIMLQKKMTIICYAKPTDKRVDTNEEKTKKEQIVGGKEGLKGATSEQKDRIYSSMERITNLLMETIECL